MFAGESYPGARTGLVVKLPVQDMPVKDNQETKNRPLRRDAEKAIFASLLFLEHPERARMHPPATLPAFSRVSDLPIIAP